jgi:hypothetical protein
MESKTPIDQFMRQFFRERTETKKRILEMRRPFRQRFCDDECLWDSRRRVIERSESEAVVRVDQSENEVYVITSVAHPDQRLRYHIKEFGESWLIREVELECGYCRLRGAGTECSFCGGKGWLNLTDWIRHQENARTAGANPDEEPVNSHFPDTTIVNFMADHFRERTAVLEEEKEIFGNFARRYCSPECDWPSWIASSEGSKNEKIAGVALVDAGAQVITRGGHATKEGFSNWRLRYNLRPAGKTWLIREVDTECLLCYQKGRSADCILCGGTIWERKRRQ